MKVNSTNAIKHQTNSKFFQRAGQVTLATLAGIGLSGGVKAETLPKPPLTLVQNSTEAIGSCKTAAYEFGETTPLKYTTITTDGITKEQCEELHKKQSEKACGQATSIPVPDGLPKNARTAQTVWRTPDGKVVETVGFAGCSRDNNTKTLFPFTQVSTENTPKYNFNDPDGTCQTDGYRYGEKTPFVEEKKQTTLKNCQEITAPAQVKEVCVGDVVAHETNFRINGVPVTIPVGRERCAQ